MPHTSTRPEHNSLAAKSETGCRAAVVLLVFLSAVPLWPSPLYIRGAVAQSARGASPCLAVSTLSTQRGYRGAAYFIASHSGGVSHGC